MLLFAAELGAILHVSIHGVCLYIQIENSKGRMVSIAVNDGYKGK